MLANESAQSLYRHARWEAIFVVVSFVIATIWTVGYCYLFGYQHAADSWVARMGLAQPRDVNNFQEFYGLPDWVFHGIVLPWFGWTIVTVLFALFAMKDDDLGAEADEEGEHGGD
ncbi:MAG: hypothetical protein ACK4RK_07055 [Gemmataceae bacterium]